MNLRSFSIAVLAVLAACGQVTAPQQCPAIQQCGSVCCAASETCISGTCTACSGGTLNCGGTCTDVSIDPAHCGACDVACTSTQTCGVGQCTDCGSGMSACDNACVDLQSDQLHCGSCTKTCDPSATCVAGACVFGYYVLTGSPSPTTVFNTIAESYQFPNNLTNSIWHRESNMILTGEFSTQGYWAFAPATNTYANAPDHDTTAGIHARMVLIPKTSTVVYSTAPSANGVGYATPAQFGVATIDRTTGLLGTAQTAAFSDNPTAGCQLTSASATQLLCYDGTHIKRYTTTAGSATLTYVDSITLSQALPAAAQCPSGGACYGSTFAFDGAYFYFASDEGSSTSLAYIVYDSNGTYVNAYTATGAGAINGVYFDWSSGRYSTHDGYGGRKATTIYGPTGSDTHNFSAVSTVHTLM